MKGEKIIIKTLSTFPYQLSIDLTCIYYHWYTFFRFSVFAVPYGILAQFSYLVTQQRYRTVYWLSSHILSLSMLYWIGA